MKVSVIIVSWNVEALLKKCLESIFKYTQGVDFEIWVVDNNSSDNTVEMVKNNFPAVKVIDNNYNAGFAKANNQPLVDGVGEEVLFMNPDMEFTENTIKIMHDFMAGRPEAGLATCRLRYPDGERQNNIKRLPGLCSQFFILLKLHHFFYFLPCIKKYLAKDFDYSISQKVENIMGAFVYAKTEKFTQLGGWNEKYWLWWEDVDLCKNAKEKGMTIMYNPDTSVIHYEGKSFEQVPSPAKQRRFIKGMLRYFKCHHPLYQYLLLLMISPVSILLAYLSKIFNIKPRPQSRV
jgi:hypothetical protein